MKKNAKKNEVKMWAATINKPEPGMGPLICGGILGDTMVTHISENKDELIKLMKKCYSPEPELSEPNIKGIKRVTVSW